MHYLLHSLVYKTVDAMFRIHINIQKRKQKKNNREIMQSLIVVAFLFLSTFYYESVGM